MSNTRIFDDPIMQELRRQRIFDTLGSVGRGMVAASQRGVPLWEGISQGLAQTGGMNTLEMLELRSRIQKERERQRREAAYTNYLDTLQADSGASALESAKQRGMAPGPTRDAARILETGTPPGAVIEEGPYGQGPSGGMFSPRQLDYLRIFPDQGQEILGKRIFEGPPERFETVKNPYGLGGVGQQSTRSGKITGYQAPHRMSSGDLVKVQTPQGPQFVPAREAAGRRPYEKPQTLTLTQQANAAEVREARRVMRQWRNAAQREGLELPEYINRRASRTNPLTGLPEPDYQSDAVRLSRLAAQVIPGEDPSVARRWSQELYGVEAPPPAPPDEAPAPEQPGFIERTYNTLFGSEEQEGVPAPQGASSAAPPQAPIEISGKRYFVQRENPDGTLTVRGPDGKLYRVRRKR